MISEHWKYLAAGYLLFAAGFSCGAAWMYRKLRLTSDRPVSKIYSVAKRSIKRFLGQPLDGGSKPT